MPHETPHKLYRHEAVTFIRFIEMHDQLLKAIRRARRVLEQPVPDTFLGRKTQEPFPNQD